MTIPPDPRKVVFEISKQAFDRASARMQIVKQEAQPIEDDRTRAGYIEAMGQTVAQLAVFDAQMLTTLEFGHIETGADPAQAKAEPGSEPAPGFAIDPPHPPAPCSSSAGTSSLGGALVRGARVYYSINGSAHFPMLGTLRALHKDTFVVEDDAGAVVSLPLENLCGLCVEVQRDNDSLEVEIQTLTLAG